MLTALLLGIVILTVLHAGNHDANSSTRRGMSTPILIVLLGGTNDAGGFTRLE
jgi:hypothetical protein